MAKRVAVIGGGTSGLTCIKCCLDEGLEPVCFETSDDIGGLWRFKVRYVYKIGPTEAVQMKKRRGPSTEPWGTVHCRPSINKMLWESDPFLLLVFPSQENPDPDRASIYHSLIINTSKEMMCYSDFPIPAHFPNYMHNSLIMDYFRMYAEHFQLKRHIWFQVWLESKFEMWS